MKISAEEYLKTLNDKSAWVFTKQETDFDTSVLATKLFNEIPDIEDTNVEQYFSEHHSIKEVFNIVKNVQQLYLMNLINYL